MAKKKQTGADDLIGRAMSELIKGQTRARELGVCEFVETVIDAFDMPLFLSQRVILKGIFGEDLDDTKVDSLVKLTEMQLMDKWIAAESCNWRHPAALLSEKNMIALLEGKEPKPYFKFQNITIQAGMRCLSGSSYLFIEGKGYQRLDEMLPTAQGDEIESPLFGRVQTRFGMKPLTDGLSRPATRVINLRSRYGYEIGGSEEHPLLVMDKEGKLTWKKMPDIHVGEFICIARNEVPFCKEDPSFEFNGKLVEPKRLALSLIHI